MKVAVDKSLCTGCGLCVDGCPEVFQLGADGLADVVSKEECASCDLEEVATSCPVNAIEVS
jgi:ferredoxin